MLYNHHNDDINKLRQYVESKEPGLVDSQIEKIVIYRDLILKWTQKINLVSKNDRSHLIENHIIDSLEILKYIPFHGRIIDIGSGAGFPGIPLAIFRPDASFALLESIHKKTLFLNTVVSELSLANVTVIEGRLENLDNRLKYDIATIRALPHRNDLLPYVKRILGPTGKIIIFEKRGTYSLIEA